MILEHHPYRNYYSAIEILIPVKKQMNVSLLKNK
jgi:hypothetical protein